MLVKKTKNFLGKKKKFWIKKMVRKKISRKKWAGKKITVGEKKTGFFFCPFGFRHGNPWMKKKNIKKPDWEN